MTRQEFITNLVRGWGYPVETYISDKKACGVITHDTAGNPQIIVFRITRSRINHGRVSICIPEHELFGEKGQMYGAWGMELSRRTNAWLRDRGFEATVDMVHSTFRVHFGKQRHYSIRIRSIGLPWKQAAEHMTNKEVEQDALGAEFRYHPAGFLGD